MLSSVESTNCRNWCSGLSCGSLKDKNIVKLLSGVISRRLLHLASTSQLHINRLGSLQCGGRVRIFIHNPKLWGAKKLLLRLPNTQTINLNFISKSDNQHSKVFLRVTGEKKFVHAAEKMHNWAPSSALPLTQRVFLHAIATYGIGQT